MTPKKIITMIVVTVATMWLSNQLAATNATARRLLKGNLVAPVATPAAKTFSV